MTIISGKRKIGLILFLFSYFLALAINKILPQNLNSSLHEEQKQHNLHIFPALFRNAQFVTTKIAIVSMKLASFLII